MPSLNALRAFEAVSRHLSFVRASEELAVSPAAVKQLVRKLEATLGASLVERRGRGLAITPQGQTGVQDLASAFTQIAAAVARIRSEGSRSRLVISAEPSFASAWLIPKLDSFRRSHSGVDVLIDSSSKIANLHRGEADIAIRFGGKSDPQLITSRLFEETICAFCSPSLAASKNGQWELGDLADAALIHWDMSDLPPASETRKWMDWKRWLFAVGASTRTEQRVLSFADYNLAVQAAIAGQGVVLGSLPVLKGLVDNGMLVAPLRENVRTTVGYDAVTTLHASKRKEVSDFLAWLKSESPETKRA